MWLSFAFEPGREFYLISKVFFWENEIIDFELGKISKEFMGRRKESIMLVI